MLKRIFNDSKENLKKNWLMSIMLCLICIVSAALIFSLIFIPMIGEFLTLFLIVPLILVPLIFSLQMLHFGLRENVAPCGKLFWRFFRAYFSPGIMGVYRVINTMLFAFLAELLTTSLVGGILVAVSNGNPAIMEALNAIKAALEMQGDGAEAALQEALANPNIRMLTFAAYVPGFGVAMMVAFLSSSFNSMSLYFKVRNPMLNPALTARMYTFSKNKIRGTLIKEYWALNWPIFVLFAAGFTGGVCIAYFNEEMTYAFGLVFGMLVGLGAMLLYLPVFTSNIESIYLAHHDEHFSKAGENYANVMQEALRNQMGMMEQQMRDLQKQQDEMEQNVPNDSNDEPNHDNHDDARIDDAKDNNIVDAEVKDDKKDE